MSEQKTVATVMLRFAYFYKKSVTYSCIDLIAYFWVIIIPVLK